MISSRLELFCKKSVLKHLAKFTEKRLCQGPFFNIVVGIRSQTLLKKTLWHWCFPVNFAKFSTTPFFIAHLQCLLLDVINIVLDRVSCKKLYPTLKVITQHLLSTKIIKNILLSTKIIKNIQM